MKTIHVNPSNPEQNLLQQAADVILDDGIIAYPTETIYGLGANALSNFAVQRVFDVKGRDRKKPILVIIKNRNQLEGLVDHIPSTAEKLMDAFWPGPLTIIFKASPHVNPILMGLGGGLGIRIPNNQICLKLLELCNVPLTSTSANLTGQNSPLSIADVQEAFQNKLDLYIDGGISSNRIPSTVLDMTMERPVIRRRGRIDKASIEKVIGAIMDEN